MAWVAVDGDESEYIYIVKPKKDYGFWNESNAFELPKGSIEKLISKQLTWEDEPVELKEADEQ